jgi:ABC-type branched-subunit amino acid transport system substrate-binding protein
MVMNQRARARGVCIVLVGMLGAAAIAGCGSGSSSGPGTTASPSSSTLNVGLIYSGSGAYGIIGTSTLAGIYTLQTELNASNLTVGGKKLVVKITALDDRSDPQTSVADAVQLIRTDHVAAILGPIATDGVPVVPITARGNVINLTSSSVVQALLNKQKYPLLFSTAASTQTKAQQIADGILHWYPNTKRVAFMAPDDSTQQSLVPLVTSDLQQHGISAQNFDYPPTTTDLSTVATKVAAYKPDMVYASTSTGGFNSVIDAMDALNGAGVPKSVPVFGWSIDPSVASQADGRPYIAQGIGAMDYLTSTSAPVVSFVANVAKYMHKPVSQLTGTDQQGFSFYLLALPILVKAAQAAGTTTSTSAIAAQLRQVSDTTLGGVEAKFEPDQTLSFPVLSQLVKSASDVESTTIN